MTSTNRIQNPNKLQLRMRTLLKINVLFSICFFSLFRSETVSALDEMTQARVDFEAATIEVKAGHSKIAIKKLESLPDALQSMPDVQVIKAQAYFDLGRIGAAKDAVEEALSSNDKEFKKDGGYNLALQLAAKISLKYPAWECEQKCDENDDSCLIAEKESDRIDRSMTGCLGNPSMTADQCESDVQQKYGAYRDMQQEHCDKCKQRCSNRH